MPNMESAGATIQIGVDPARGVATVTPPALVTAANGPVRWELDRAVAGEAEVTLPAEAIALTVRPGEPAGAVITRSGAYYVVVRLERAGKVGAIAVLIVDP